MRLTRLTPTMAISCRAAQRALFNYFLLTHKMVQLPSSIVHRPSSIHHVAGNALSAATSVLGRSCLLVSAAVAIAAVLCVVSVSHV